MAAGAYDIAADLSLEATLAVPGELPRLEFFQATRARALLKGERWAEAIAAAKGLYNVSGMGYTKEAMAVIADALAAAYPKDKDIRHRFLQEQIDGARPSTRPVAAVPANDRGKLVLASAKIDAALYERALRRESGQNFGAMTATETSCSYAISPMRPCACLSGHIQSPLTRSWPMPPRTWRGMKAIDGTIGRANAFVLSVRPKDKQ